MAVQGLPTPRLVQVLGHLGIATSSWYRPSLDENLRKRPGPVPKEILREVVEAVVKMATDNPWYGYKPGFPCSLFTLTNTHYIIIYKNTTMC